MKIRNCSLFVILTVCLLHQAFAQTKPAQYSDSKELVIIDTDIGDDIDDAFALGLAVQSPEFRILGVTTAFGDTKLRAKLAARFLDAVGRQDIPVIAGVETAAKGKFSQAEYAERGDAKEVQPGSAPDFILDQIRKHPGEITL